MNSIIFIIPLIVHTISMHIPEDAEVLDGYNIDTSPELYPGDSYFEARSLGGHHFISPIRDKRSPIFESQRLRNQLKPLTRKIYQTKGGQFIQFKENNEREPFTGNPDESNLMDFRRNRRHAEMDTKKNEPIETNGNTETIESLPTAEKQIMEPFQPEARSQSVIMDRWTKAPFEYSKVQKEEDSLAEATVADGINARTPRVNFVTQQKKKPDSTEQIDQKSSSTKSEVYKNIPENQQDARYYQRNPPVDNGPNYRKLDDYSQRYDRYLYDRYYDDYYDRYRPSYQRSLDTYDRYMPRTPSYPDAYYDYPDTRYDLPEPRDYRPLYSNDLNYDRYPSTMSNRNRRIIYYANLPEVVRTPFDHRYKSYNRYDDRYDPYYGYKNDYDGYRVNNRFSNTGMGTMGAMKDDGERDRNRDRERDRDRDAGTKKKQQYSRAPIKVLTPLTIKDEHSRPSSLYGNRPGEYGYSYY